MNAFFDTGYKEILLKLGFGGKKGKKQGRRYTAAPGYSPNPPQTAPSAPAATAASS